MTPETFFGLFNYWIVICLMMTGFYVVISSGNLIKTVIGLNIFQTSVFLLYITMGKITDADARVTAPILEGGHSDDHGEHAAHAEHAMHTEHATHEHVAHGHGEAGHAGHQVHESIEQATHADPSAVGHGGVAEHAHEAAEVIYSNPLPSVLMLTAIVVGIATTALALALIVRIREDYGSIEEDEILELDKELQ